MLPVTNDLFLNDRKIICFLYEWCLSFVSIFVNLSVWHFSFSWSSILIPLMQLLMPDFDEFEWTHVTARWHSQLCCYCTDNAPLIRALSFIKWDWLLLCFYAGILLLLFPYKWTSVLFMHFYDWYFVSSWNQIAFHIETGFQCL